MKRQRHVRQRMTNARLTGLALALLALMATGGCDLFEYETMTAPVAVVEGDVPEHGFMGARLTGAKPITVVKVTPGGPAAQAGVVEGDVVVAVNGQRPGGRADVMDLLKQTKPGDVVRLGLTGNGGDRSVELRLIGYPDLMLLGAASDPDTGADAPRRSSSRSVPH